MARRTTNLSPADRLAQLERRRDGFLLEAERCEAAAADRKADIEAAEGDPEDDHRYVGFVSSARQNRADAIAADEQVVALRGSLGPSPTRAPRRHSTPAARQASKATRRPAGETS